MRRILVLLPLLLIFPCFAQTDAKTKFEQKCALCHGPDGKAQIAMSKKMGSPDLTSQIVQSQTDAQIRQAITNGKGKMPPYGGILGKDGVEDMLKYIRGLAPSKNAK